MIEGTQVVAGVKVIKVTWNDGLCRLASVFLCPRDLQAPGEIYTMETGPPCNSGHYSCIHPPGMSVMTLMTVTEYTGCEVESHQESAGDSRVQDPGRVQWAELLHLSLNAAHFKDDL